MKALLTAGVALSKKEKITGFVQYKQTQRLLQIWKANMKYQKRKSIAEKIAAATHISTKRALQDTVPYIQHIFQNNKELSDQVAVTLDHSNEEVAWLRK